jgi:uncharacterized repeat protein (TIGR02543 family)
MGSGRWYDFLVWAVLISASVLIFDSCSFLMTPSEARAQYGQDMCGGDPDCKPRILNQLGCDYKTDILHWDRCDCQSWDSARQVCRNLTNATGGVSSRPLASPAITFGDTIASGARTPLAAPPAINFVAAAAFPTVVFDDDGSGLYPLIAHRQADGTFTAQTFRRTETGSTWLGALPSIQDSFAQAGGMSPRTPKAHPTLLADMAGTSSVTAVATTLGGASPNALISTGSANQISVSLDRPDTLGKTITNYAVGTNDGTTPSSLLVADFNGDGKRDVAVLSSPFDAIAGTVSILQGKGDGTLGTAANFNTGIDPRAMTAFDFNGDGRPDLAIANKGGGPSSQRAVTVLLANADGSMRSGASYQVPALAPIAIVAADFDGNGKADLLVADAYSETLTLLSGNGDGTFQVKSPLAGNKLYSVPVYMAAGDLNNDGKPDLAVLNSDGTVTVLINGGDGSFPTQRRYVAGTGLSTGFVLSYYGSMFVTDFNDDGNLDLVLALGHPDILYPGPAFTTVLFGNGDGTLQAAAGFEAVAHPRGLAVADFNGDGRADLVVAGDYGSPFSTTAAVLPARAGGGFQAAAGLTGAVDAFNWVGAADLNGDGRQDIVAVSDASVSPVTITTWLGQGNGTFQTKSTHSAGSRGGNAWAALGDLNGDGLPDLVAARGGTDVPPNADDSVFVMLARSSGGFNVPTTVKTGTNTVQLALADVNGDGKLDLIAVNYGYQGTAQAAGSVSVLLGKGDGTFQTPAAYAVEQTPQSLAVADVTRDGKLDLVVGTTTGTASKVAVLPGSGSGTFGTPVSFDTYARVSRLVVADFDRDGKPDLALIHTAGDRPISTMRGNGDGTFQSEVTWLAGYSPAAAVASDFDGDGKPDLAVAASLDPSARFASSSTDGVVAIFRNSSGGLSSQVTTTIATNPPGLTVVVDGSSLTSPQTFTWQAGSTHTVSAGMPQTSGGVRYVFGAWSDGGAQSHSIAAPSSDTTFTATLTASQYLLTTASAPAAGGTVTANPASSDGYYNAGVSVQLTAAPAGGYTFTGWSGDLSGTTSPQAVTMSAARGVTANFGSGARYPISGHITASNVALANVGVALSGSASGSMVTDQSGAYTFANLAGGGTYTVTPALAGYTFTPPSVTVTGLTSSRTVDFTAAASAVQGLRFVAVAPCRVVDTRLANWALGGPIIPAGASRDFPLPSGYCSIPSGARAYSLNVTVVPQRALGYLTIWPTGQAQPYVSTLNSPDGRIKANAAIVPAGTGGAVSVYVTDPSHVILDVNGYFVPASTSGSLSFYPVTPCRVADTRNATGALGGPAMYAGQSRTFPVTSSPCGLPASAAAYSMNFTVVPKGGFGYLTVYPAGGPQPIVSTLNAPTGAITANAAIVPAGGSGSINVYVTNNTDLVIDVNGYFAAPGATGALSLYAVAPCRISDTRLATGTFGGPTLGGSQSRSYPVPNSSCSIPATAQAYSLNATVVPGGALGYLTLWPSGGTMPVVSTLNALDGSIVANAALVPAGSNGAVSAYVTDAVHLILDINGYFAP